MVVGELFIGYSEVILLRVFAVLTTKLLPSNELSCKDFVDAVVPDH